MMNLHKNGIRLVLLSLCCGISATSYASSPQAWEDHLNEVKTKCIQASNLFHAKAAGDLIGFDDTVGFDVLALEGTIKKSPSTELCLYDKKTQVAHIADSSRLFVTQTVEPSSPE